MSRENYSYLFPCTAIFDPGNISMILEQTVNQSAFLRFFQRSWGVFFFYSKDGKNETICAYAT